MKRVVVGLSYESPLSGRLLEVVLTLWVGNARHNAGGFFGGFFLPGILPTWREDLREAEPVG